MEILVVNDDGYDAEGIKILANALKRFGNVTLVAPNGGRSASSHSIVMREPIEFNKVFVLDGIESYSCSGMPADCVTFSSQMTLGGASATTQNTNDGTSYKTVTDENGNLVNVQNSTWSETLSDNSPFLSERI